MPPADFCSSATRRTTTRSLNGRNFMECLSRMEQGKRWGADPVLIGTGMALAHGKCQGATSQMASRTRHFKCCRDSLRDWATSKTDGFKMLLERGTPELTGEAIVLRHGNQFDSPVVSAVRARLGKAGADTSSLPS